MKNKNGFSLVEVIIAASVFSIMAISLLSTFSSLREASNRSARKLQAAYYAKQLLEDLRAKVDQGIWGTGTTPLWGPGGAAGELNCDNGSHDWPAGWGGASSPLINPPYNARILYTCTKMPNESRQVQLQITWTEP